MTVSKALIRGQVLIQTGTDCFHRKIEQNEGWLLFVFFFFLCCSVSYLFCKFTFYIRGGGNRRPEQARCNADSQIKCIHLVFFRSHFYTMQYSKDVTQENNISSGELLY